MYFYALSFHQIFVVLRKENNIFHVWLLLVTTGEEHVLSFCVAEGMLDKPQFEHTSISELKRLLFVGWGKIGVKDALGKHCC